MVERAQTSYVHLEKQYYRFARNGYGLGLYHSDYEGDTLLHHFGGFSGYMSHISFMPEHDIGVVAFSNEIASGGLLPHVVAAYIYDLLLGKEGIEEKYHKELFELKMKVDQNQKEMEMRLEQRKTLLENAASNPSHWNYVGDNFIGTYHNPRIGEFQVVKRDSNTLIANYGNHSAVLHPLDSQLFIIDWQLTGYYSPPIQLKVVYNDTGSVKSLMYDSREFVKLPQGMSPEYLNEIYKIFRVKLDSIAHSTEENGEPALTDIVNQYLHTGAVSEPYLNAMGYQYLRSGKGNMAIALFRYNVAHYPNSINAYDSLAEGYVALARKAEAVEIYKKLLNMDPGNNNAKNKLKELN